MRSKNIFVATVVLSVFILISYWSSKSVLQTKSNFSGLCTLCINEKTNAGMSKKLFHYFILVPLWFIIISLVFFHLCKALFSGFIQFKGKFVHDHNTSKHRDRASLRELRNSQLEKKQATSLILVIDVPFYGIFRYFPKDKNRIPRFEGKCSFLCFAIN